MAKKKKVNPRRIPLSKDAINKDAILEEAVKDDLTHAWLLVAQPLLDAGYDLLPLSKTVYDYLKTERKKSNLEYNLKRVHTILKFPFLSLDIRRIKSSVDLEAYKRRVAQVALNNALCIVYLGLETVIPADDLERIFFSADLARAELEHGLTSYDELKKALVEQEFTINEIELPG